MTRIAAFSDMQLSSRAGDDRPDLDAVDIGRVDLCVVAGDHDPPLARSLQSLAPLARRLPVVYVPGNRDYYRSEISAATREARALAAGLGIVLLQDDVAEVAGVRLAGATLFTDYALYGDPEAAMEAAARLVNDHRSIAAPSGPFSPRMAAAVHARSRDLIEACLASPYAGPTVVVTHHAPHPGCLAPRHGRDPLNAAFASDLGPILSGPSAPDLWIHGGTHHPVDRAIGRTRVVSNPGGYDGEVAGFAFDKVVDVPAASRT